MMVSPLRLKAAGDRQVSVFRCQQKDGVSVPPFALQASAGKQVSGLWLLAPGQPATSSAESKQEARSRAALCGRRFMAGTEAPPVGRDACTGPTC